MLRHLTVAVAVLLRQRVSNSCLLKCNCCDQALFFAVHLVAHVQLDEAAAICVPATAFGLIETVSETLGYCKSSCRVSSLVRFATAAACGCWPSHLVSAAAGLFALDARGPLDARPAASEGGDRRRERWGAADAAAARLGRQQRVLTDPADPARRAQPRVRPPAAAAAPAARAAAAAAQQRLRLSRQPPHPALGKGLRVCVPGQMAMAELAGGAPPAKAPEPAADEAAPVTPGRAPAERLAAYEGAALRGCCSASAWAACWLRCADCPLGKSQTCCPFPSARSDTQCTQPSYFMRLDYT